MIRFQKITTFFSILLMCICSASTQAGPDDHIEEEVRRAVVQKRVVLKEEPVLETRRVTRADPGTSVCEVVVCGMATIFVLVYLIILINFGERVGRQISRF